MQQNPKELHFQQTLAVTDKDFKIIEPYLVPEIESYFNQNSFSQAKISDEPKTEISAITANLFCCWLNDANLIYSRCCHDYEIEGRKSRYDNTYKFQLNYK